YTVAYTATVNAEAVGQVSNAVVGNQGDCEVDCEIDVPVEDPSVTDNKEADTAGPVSVGDTITYTLPATVSESQLVTDLGLTDTLGTGLTCGAVGAQTATDAANPTPFVCTGELECTLAAGTLPGTYTVAYTATVNGEAEGKVSHEAGGNQGDCEVDCEIDVPVEDPSVTYNKEADTAGPVSVGDTITSTLTATVCESQLVTDLVLTDSLGTGLPCGPLAFPTRRSSELPTPFVCTGELECTLAAGTLPGTYTVAYTATVNAEAVGQVSNAVVGNQGDCEVDCEIDVPVEDPSVTYNKEADTAGPVSVGDTITYTLTATVSESQLVTDLVLTDTLGTGLTFGTVGAQTSTDAANP